ncbi:hypothetical protein ACFFK0_18530 [Paenibacillus chartarius]|uniref:Uncharacterized protein n=1 Tax=Paenibacillus chartarius TaxID=747481 RepID=A0ABV6DP66_9BACL
MKREHQKGLRSIASAQGSRLVRRKKKSFASPLSAAGVFIGPSVDGSDKEFVKVLSGDVTRRKPSFA